MWVVLRLVCVLTPPGRDGASAGDVHRRTRGTRKDWTELPYRQPKALENSLGVFEVSVSLFPYSPLPDAHTHKKLFPYDSMNCRYIIERNVNFLLRRTVQGRMV